MALEKLRQHRLFLVNETMAQCLDCRRDFLLPEISSKNDAEWLEHSKARMALLVRAWARQPMHSRVRYCYATRRQYYNPTHHTLNLSGLGIPEVKPGEIFELGSATSSLTVFKYAPQIKAIEDIDRKDTCLDLWPLTVDEFVHFTTLTGEFNELSFSGSQSNWTNRDN